jgi:hypothetical protein
MRGVFETKYHSVEQLGSSFVVRDQTRGEVLSLCPDLESAKATVRSLEKHLPESPKADNA